MKGAAADPVAEAERLVRAGKPRAAEAVLRDALSRAAGAGDWRVISTLARLLIATGRAHEAGLLIAPHLAARPEDADVLILAGVCAQMTGRSDEALALSRRAYDVSGGSARACLALGRVLQQRFDPQAAVRVLREGVERDPDDLEVRYALATAIIARGDAHHARADLETVVAKMPGFAEARVHLGACLRLEGRVDEAIAQYEEARKMRPMFAPAVTGLALALSALGRFEEARERLAAAVALGMDDPQLLLTLAQNHQSQKRHAEARTIARRVADDPRVPPGARCAALLTLGAALESEGNYDDAFNAYSAGNGLFQGRFDPASFAAKTDALIATFSRDNLLRMERSGVTDATPVFIVGMPRSGTTLVEQIIGAHPRAHAAGELTLLSEAASRLAREQIGGYPACVASLGTDHLAALAHEYLAALRGQPGVPPPAAQPAVERITEKMPGNYLHLGLIRSMLPGARVIHCVRDPMDNGLSIFATRLTPMHSYAYDLANIGFVYREYRRLMHHWAATLDIEVLDVSYEALVADPEAGARRIIAHVGLEWDDKCLEFHRAGRAVLTASSGQVRQPIYDRSIGRAARFGARLDPLRAALGDLASPRPA